MQEDADPSERKTNTIPSTDGVLSYVAKQYAAVAALADPDDPEAQAYLARRARMLDASEQIVLWR